MRAVVLERTSVAIRDIPKHAPGPGEILVKVHYTGLNPTDWKHALAAEEVPALVGTVPGCDFAGEVAELGEGVTAFTVGQSVAGAVHGANPSAPYPNGSYAEYVVADAGTVWAVPENIPLEVAAAQMTASLTTSMMLWQTSQKLPTPDAPGDFSTWYLVWSSASSVGQWLVQIAHLSGLRVVATCSPKHFERMKKLGADALFDYRDPDVVEKIREVTEGKLFSGGVCEVGYSPEEHQRPVKVMAKGAVLSSATHPAQDSEDGVEVVPHLAYTALGRAIEMPVKLPAMPEHHAAAVRWASLMSRLLKEGKVQPVAVRVYGGLDSVPNAFADMREGKVSGERIVFTVKEA